MRVLTWNLYHGRSVPPAGRSLATEFAALIAAWAWDVALLQEVPPWWPTRLGAAAGAHPAVALTARNALLPLRRRIAERRPDLIGSNGGGANVTLVRGDAVRAHRRVLLRRWPERRVAQLVWLESGVLVINTHLSTPAGPESGSRARARDELRRLWTLALSEAGPMPLVLGGDLNLFEAELTPEDGLAAAGHAVDHVVARGWGAAVASPPADRRILVPGRGRVLLSDHEPVIVELRRPTSRGGAAEKRSTDGAGRPADYTHGHDRQA